MLLVQSVFGILAAGGYELFVDIWLVHELLAVADPHVIATLVVAGLAGVANVVAFIGQQVAIKRGKATSAYPVSQSINIVLSATGGILIFGQSITNIVAYVLALGFATAGTALLGKYQASMGAAPAPPGGDAA